MYLTVIVPCNFSDVDHDYPDTLWGQVEIGEAIAGGEVVKAIRYHANRSLTVDLAFIGKPQTNEAEWDCYKLAEGRPQCIEVQLSGIGEPRLGFSLGESIEPKLGEMVPAKWEPISSETEGARMRAVESRWYTNRIDTYHPVEDSPYEAIHITWCKARHPVAA